MLHLLGDGLERNHVGQAHRTSPIEQRKGDAGGREMLPDELEHEEFVEIGIEQGARDWIKIPVVVVGTAREVDDHAEGPRAYLSAAGEGGWLRHGECCRLFDHKTAQAEAGFRGGEVNLRFEVEFRILFSL